jgi:dolichyl-phosphate beta-glucosyltransferase
MKIHTVHHLVFSFYLQCRCCFDVEIVYLCKHLRILMVEVFVNWTEIHGSKVRMTRILHVVYRLVLVKVGYGLRIWKMYS